jgi:hypothetical protein
VRRRDAAQTPVVPVPRLWPNGTVVCLATGPSLTQADVDLVRGKVDGVIAISDAIDKAPWADVLYSCDGRWWTWRYDTVSVTVAQSQLVKQYTGLKYALKDDTRKFAKHGVQTLKHTGRQGLELRSGALRDGANSGYQAINLAVHFGATRILLLGYDMRSGPRGEDHCFGKHPDGSKPNYASCLDAFPTIVKPLAAAGVTVVNCTRRTALTCFPRESLESALALVLQAVVA